ncbi:MAG: hypothetical protein HYT20_03905 [Candidatus Nealsonbacteria bacterium]|nr:hypothetical protein [Candidatus Nealsonbacteria bacterium]
MTEASMLGGNALAKVAGPLKDFAEKLSGEQGERWLEAFKRFLRKEEPWPKFPVWKTIKLGTGLKTADDFRKVLKGNGFEVSDWANDILEKSAFIVAIEGIKVDLVKVTVAELGFKKGARRDQIYDRAKELGLELCSPEVGPQLRLQYQNQPNSEWVFVGMEPIFDSEGNMVVFVVRCHVELCLDCAGGNPYRVWNPGSLWVFRLP